MRITHLSLPDRERLLVAMRSAQCRESLSEYVGRLVRADAEASGLSEYLEDPVPQAPNTNNGGRP